MGGAQSSEDAFDSDSLFAMCANVETAAPRTPPIRNRIAAGADHSVVVFGAEAVLFQWGGDPNSLGSPGVLVAHRLKTVTKVCMVACGAYHTLVLGENGRAYGCGAADRGQLLSAGGGPDFRLRDLDLPCNEVAAGGDVSCFLSQRGHVLACGDRDALMTAHDVC